MPDFNALTLTATVSRSAQMTALQNGSQLCHLSLEVDRSYPTKTGELKKRSCYFNATVYGRSAIRAQHELVAGARVLVQGEIAENRSKSQSGEWSSSFGIDIKDWQVLAYSTMTPPLPMQQAQPQPAVPPAPNAASVTFQPRPAAPAPAPAPPIPIPGVDEVSDDDLPPF